MAIGSAAIAGSGSGSGSSTITDLIGLTSLGQVTMAGSLPVVLASDQSVIPVTGTFWQATQPVSLASVPSHAVTNAGTFAVQATLQASPTFYVGIVKIGDGTNLASVSATGAITVDGSAVTQPVSNAGLTALNGAISGTEVQVDVLTMPTVTVTATNLDVQSGGADLATSTQAAGIQTAVETLDNAISGTEMQVDVVAALPAGTNAIGKLAANSGVDIGDVDITSIAAGDNNIGNVDIVSMPSTITGIGHGVKTVTTAGTDVALAASTTCKRITIQAQTDNTNIIAVGGSGVDATIATGTGVVLYPGDVFELEIDNLADVYIDSLVNGEGVRFCYFT